jgi:hypothetical protein
VILNFVLLFVSFWKYVQRLVSAINHVSVGLALAATILPCLIVTVKRYGIAVYSTTQRRLDAILIDWHGAERYHGPTGVSWAHFCDDSGRVTSRVPPCPCPESA